MHSNQSSITLAALLEVFGMLMGHEKGQEIVRSQGIGGIVLSDVQCCHCLSHCYNDNNLYS